MGVYVLCHFELLKRGCAHSVVGLELAEFKGGSLHDGFGSFDGFGRFWRAPWPLLLVPTKYRPRDDRDCFEDFGGCGGSGCDGYPP